MQNPHPPSQKARRSNSLGGFIGATFVLMAGIIIFFVVSMEKQPFLKRAGEFNLASETHRKIFAECLALHKQLDDLKYPHVFSDIQINLIDPLPAKDQIASALASCLSKNPQSPFAVQGEVFSSEYEGKDGDIVVLQLNFFDKTGNKIMELNHHWTTSEFEPSDASLKKSTAAPSNRTNPIPNAATSPSGSFEEIKEGSTDLEKKID